MTKRLLMSMILCLIGITVLAQRTVQNLFLSNQKEKKSDWFFAYSNGDYAKAYQLMTKKDISLPKNQFLTNAFQYANRETTIIDSTLEIWGDSFYNQFPKSKIHFTNGDKVILPLERNLFLATIGKDSLRVVLDTGGHGISISKRLVEKYNLPTDTNITGSSYMPAFKRVSKTSPTIIKTIKFGNLELSNLRAEYTVSAKDNGEFDSKQQYDIFMGIDILIGLIDYVRFDWENKEIIFSNQKLQMENTQPIFFFDSKPITVLQLGDKNLTTVFDTGSPIDILNKEYYKELYKKKEEKKYGNYAYNLYTVPINIRNAKLNLGIADYMEGFNLKLDKEIIDLIIGTTHQRLTIDLKNNKLEIK
ncbi:Hypothetical protein I595_378 [Croceitalea dokdonensis DOKDO 023]|uniref:Aspartyl protease n=1 Tax=Croceitalea dokdonensis DOKDO 023 TaxID=1300341 RepID=A0A0P7B472_9FLAO|nr:retropepsin-like aspartic protease [Croceitalea dokdonensis]KPM33475.1 Hypothetical protein I595_378 [Croceitalea dokdonensis DOKDO 023]